MMHNEKEQIQEIKVLVIGESGVGKTGIIDRYTSNTFNLNTQATLGFNFRRSVVPYKKKKFILSIWDTAGQERYHSMARLFFNDAKIVLFVYAINDKNSFEALKFWYEQVDKILGKDNVLKGVAGNKWDLKETIAVDEKTGRDFADKNDSLFALVSAKTGEGITDFINLLVYAYADKTYWESDRLQTYFEEELEEDKMKINLSKIANKKEQSGCCLSNKEDPIDSTLSSRNTLTNSKNSKVPLDKRVEYKTATVTVLLLGPKNAGKSTFMKTYFQRKKNNSDYDHEIEPTSEIIRDVTEFELHNKIFKLKIVDTPGGFYELKNLINYVKASMAILWMFEIGSKKSFVELKNMIEYVGEKPGIIVGGKSDLQEREVDINDIKNYATNKNLTFYEYNKNRNDLNTYIVTKIFEIAYVENTSTLKHNSEKK